MSDRYQRQYHNVGCDLDECPGHWTNFLSTDDKEKAVARWNNQWHKGRNDFLQGKIKESHQLIDDLRTSREELSLRLNELRAITNEMAKVCEVWDFAPHSGGDSALQKFRAYKTKWNAH
jgi:hypothetical protein